MSQGLKALDGVVDAEVFFDEQRADVKYDPAVVKPEKLVEAVIEIGFRATLLEKEPEPRGETSGGDKEPEPGGEASGGDDGR